MTLIANQLNGTAGFSNTLSYSATTTIATSTLQIPFAQWVDQDASYWANIASTSARATLLAQGNTWALVQTFTGNTIENGTPVFNAGATFNTTLPTTSVVPTSSTQLTNKSYVDSVALQGAPSATETATGTVMIATGAQAAASTKSAYTGGARYVLPAALATSTSQVAQNSIVVTQSTGYIDTSFISPTATYSLASTTNIGSSPAFNIGKHIFVATTTQQFIKPTGVNMVDVQCVGGGGGGGAQIITNYFGNQGGGGGGAYIHGSVDITSTSSILINIGAGGSGNNSGGTTSFGNFLSANGGAPGSMTESNSSTANFFVLGGAGGSASTTASTTIISINGGDGTAGMTSVTNLVIPGMGGSTYFIGNRQTGAYSTQTQGNNGIMYGQGASGGQSSTNGSPVNGATGASGACIITY